MGANTFGDIFRLTTFGESHGAGIGGVVDGCPAGLALDESVLQGELDRRRPGQGGPASTTRKEADRVRLLSGVFQGRTTGTPIGFFIENTGMRSRDYSRIRDVYRPGHGDATYEAKFGVRDHRGGGRASARETAARVAGGAVAGQVLGRAGIRVFAYTVELGGLACNVVDPQGAADRPFGTPDPDGVDALDARVREVREAGDTLGGVVEVRATGLPPGLGEPVFDKLDARLAYALMGVGAVKACEIGAGMEAARLTGSRNNDPLTPRGFTSNNAGGVLAGVSSGQDLVARAWVKPIPSIGLPQQTVDRHGNPVEISVGGRHDIAAIPRINPVLAAMVRLVLADFLLAHRARAGFVPGFGD
jgi:chorismate synthase